MKRMESAHEDLPHPIRRVDPLGCLAGGGWVAGDFAMSRFFVGQLVRKVRGEWNLGQTMTVVGYDDDPTGRTLCVNTHTPGIGEQYGVQKHIPAGTDVWGFPEEFEPIVEGNQPCESEFQESLDRLLEGLPA